LLPLHLASVPLLRHSPPFRITSETTGLMPAMAFANVREGTERHRESRRSRVSRSIWSVELAVQALLCRLPIVLIAIGAALVGGCAGLGERNSVPSALADQAVVPGIPDARYWGDVLPVNIDMLIEQQALQDASRPPHQENYLALSGGGSDGAFGAGLLVGWTRSGRRPQFDIVTGISTGALIAPFAFLGPAYDAKLKQVYTAYDTSQIASVNILAGLLGGVAITEDSKLKDLISHFVTPDMVAAVASEHARGRRLFVGTTNLDSQRPVIWDMGAIAVNGSPQAIQLFRDVLRASASVPGVFPPVLIEVSAGGKLAQEMHVDGGTTAEVFFLPPQVLKSSGSEGSRGRRLFVVSNGKLLPEYTPVAENTFSIVKASVHTLIKSQWTSDLVALYRDAQTAGIDFNLAGVPNDFDKVSTEPFDPVYMRALFKRGYTLGVRGDPWAKAPPRLLGY
jgi:predicted acylesterase/phospholipase RssA